MIVVSLSACTTPTEKTNTISTVSSVANSGNIITQKNYQQMLQDTSPKIKDSEEFKACMSQYTDSCIKESVQEISRKTNSSEICNALTNTADIEACTFGITLSNALKSKKIEDCDTLSNTQYKSSCKSSIIRMNASESKNIALCNDIAAVYLTGQTANSELQNCKMQVIMNPDFSDKTACNQLDEAYKLQCIQMIETNEKLKKSRTVGENTETIPLSTGSVSSGTLQSENK